MQDFRFAGRFFRIAAHADCALSAATRHRYRAVPKGLTISGQLCALAVGPADPLGGFPHSLADYVGNPGDELPVGGLAPVGTDGVAEVAAENVHVRPGPGDLDQVADAPLHPGGGGVELGGDLGIEAEGLEVKISGSNILGDKAYGTNSIRTYITEQRASYTIPPKRLQSTKRI